MKVLFCKDLIKACFYSLLKIQFPADVSLADLLHRQETKSNLAVELGLVSDAITQEIMEEFYYKLRDRIRHPFCTEMWYPAGIKVLSALGHGYAKLKLKALVHSQSVDQSELETLLIREQQTLLQA